jgi:hypothetical protein
VTDEQDEQIDNHLASPTLRYSDGSVSLPGNIRAAMEAVRRGEDITLPAPLLLVSQHTVDRAYAIIDKHGDTPEVIAEATRIVLMQGAYRSPLEDDDA